ncbi:S-adenosylmethionine decarboxylase [Phlegmacium glaucopus]|nr:S-adenosylmethionine decarboxylase [Phlegmacium glaucopus]
MSPDVADDYQASAPFEGPEKLLEIWFAPSANDVPHLECTQPHKTGLRSVSRDIWEEMLGIVQCRVLNVIEGQEMDAYLLSESSFFVSPHRLILKTCGTTLNLLGLPRILEIAAREAKLPTVYRCFYSRKSFMFPERQLGPHRDWKGEVEYLDNIFRNGAAYTVGKVNGDHWLLYITGLDKVPAPNSIPPSHPKIQGPHTDYTIEILMSDLSSKARQSFFFSDLSSEDVDDTPSSRGAAISQQIGISQIFPPSSTTLDAYAFQPCGYSSNALIKWGPNSLKNGLVHETTNGLARPALHGEGYYTIHVTPEQGWSYASFECNIPLSSSNSSHQGKFPDVKSLIERVVNIFEPGRITLTLFMSSEDNDIETANAIDAAQRAFKDTLTECAGLGGTNEIWRVYKRTDKINYVFGGYDLAFASFELK